MSEHLVITQTAEDKLADERRYIRWHVIVCRECDFTTSMSTDDITVHNSHTEHVDETNHLQFWKYTLSRGTGRFGYCPYERPPED